MTGKRHLKMPEDYCEVEELKNGLKYLDIDLNGI